MPNFHHANEVLMFPRIADHGEDPAGRPGSGRIRLVAPHPGLFVQELWSEAAWSALYPAERPKDAEHCPEAGVWWRIRFTYSTG